MRISRGEDLDRLKSFRIRAIERRNESPDKTDTTQGLNCSAYTNSRPLARLSEVLYFIFDLFFYKIFFVDDLSIFSSLWWKKGKDSFSFRLSLSFL